MHKLNPGQWSKKYGDCCAECGTNERPHFAKGLCKKCYQQTSEYKEYSRKYYRKFKDRIQKNIREYYEIHKEQKRKSAIEYYRKNRIRNWVIQTIRNHKSRGYQVNILPDELEKMAKKTMYCPICKCELKWKIGKLCNESPTLDRINNKNIIDKDSIWIICNKCNGSKRNRTLKEFNDYCKKFIQNYPFGINI